MGHETQAPGPPALSAAALREWSSHVEGVMRGLGHALNNRAAALSALIELGREPDDDPAMTSSILGTELERVRGLADVVRALGPPRGGTEAFSPADAAAEAQAVLTLHADHRDRPIVIDTSGAPPARVARWMFVRALIALGAAASKRGGEPGRKTDLRIVVVEDGEWLAVRIEGAGGGGGARCEELSAYASEVSRAMGGGPLEGECGFRVPTLAALRRREAR